MKIILSVVFAVISGCASNSGVVAMGPDTYFVSRQAATGLTGMGSLKAEAMGEAGQFCTQRGKTAEVISEKDAKPPFIVGNFPQTEIRFRCV